MAIGNSAETPSAGLEAVQHEMAVFNATPVRPRLRLARDVLAGSGAKMRRWAVYEARGTR
jgi:hypothetical protein